MKLWKDKQGGHGCLHLRGQLRYSCSQLEIWKGCALNPTQFITIVIVLLPLPTLHTCPISRSSKWDHPVLFFLSRPGEWNPAPRQLSSILLVTLNSLFHIHPIISNAGYFRKSTPPIPLMPYPQCLRNQTKLNNFFFFLFFFFKKQANLYKSTCKEPTQYSAEQPGSSNQLSIVSVRVLSISHFHGRQRSQSYLSFPPCRRQRFTLRFHLWIRWIWSLQLCKR